MSNLPIAPGAPGIPAHWTSSAKSGVGTSLNPASRVWFTLSHGIFNEIYYPRLDTACVRDMEMLVTDGQDFFSEEKRHTHSEVQILAANVPGYHLKNTCQEGRFLIEKDIWADTWRDVVLQYTRFVPLKGKLEDYHLYVLLAPHIENHGAGNTAWVGDYKGRPMLFASRQAIALGLACSAPWLKRSVGFVGFSDGWQDLGQHKQMEWEYGLAENGNVALIGEIDLKATMGSFVLAVGFGYNDAEAGQRALASLYEGHEVSRQRYIDEWHSWQKSLLDLRPKEQSAVPSSVPNLYQMSTAVMRIHESKRFPGGLAASLSIPWGFAKGDDDLGGYHLVWPRDLAEMAGGLLAAGAHGDARRVLWYLRVTQEQDGHWPQNMWLDGQPYWGGIQMDETAFPILAVELARREKAINENEVRELWPMVRMAASFVVQNGPVTQQDRWEEDPGYSPFTLAVEIAGLLAAADMADFNHEPEAASFFRQTADAWNDSIDRWIYVTGTDLAQQVGVEGYYVRVAAPDTSGASSPAQGFVPIKNRPPGQSTEPAAAIVSPDALALVRFGLRAADDPRILNTINVIDALLKVETTNGPAWHRYNDDGYGEHEDGSPFDGTGTGRAWPLLTGERAHYELAAGHLDEAVRLRKALETFANEGGLLPEQIWDAEDIPERELFCGRPSGSAMPLGWAHAEYIKLLHSLKDERIFDLPQVTVQRYLVDKVTAPFTIWSPQNKVHAISAGKNLRVEASQPFALSWTADSWKTNKSTLSTNSGLGVNLVDLPVASRGAGSTISFTFFWRDENRWEGVNYDVSIS
jgi:glucoamylase